MNQQHNPFEGCEKRLVITFKGNGNLQNIQKTEWTQILKHAQCSILNTIQNKQCIAHLLSESSLFIFKQKLMIKTCGTTTLLKIIPILIENYPLIHLQIDNIFYSHSNFMFPQNQPPIYRNFENETKYLNKIFDKKGKAITLGGSINRWHCYEYDAGNQANNINSSAKQCKTLEIVLFDLDPECMRYFFEKNSFSQSFVDEYILNNCHIPSKVKVDSYLFKPCGYSLNGILNDTYFSIHITPENEGSFISFETNYDYDKEEGGYENVLNDILKTFKPKRFGFAVNRYGAFDVAIKGCRYLRFNGFNLINNASHTFSRYHDVKWFNYQCNEIPSDFPIAMYYIGFCVILLICIGCLYTAQKQNIHFILNVI